MDSYYLVMTKGKKYLYGINSQWQRTCNMDKAYRFKDLEQALKYRHLAGLCNRVIKMPEIIIVKTGN